MTATRTHGVQQGQQDWTSPLEPAALLTAWRGVASRWRERPLDPVPTLPWFFVQILPGNTACTHRRHLTPCPVTASASCPACMQLPLTVCERLLRSVSHALPHHPLEAGGWWGQRPCWVDGSRCSMPDIPVLPKPCGQPSQQRPGCGCPVAHLWALLQAAARSCACALTPRLVVPVGSVMPAPGLTRPPGT